MKPSHADETRRPTHETARTQRDRGIHTTPSQARRDATKLAAARPSTRAEPGAPRA